MSIWVVLNFPNQLSNTGTLRVFHNGMWQSWNPEVHVHLVHHHRFMILVMNSNGFFHSFTKYFIINVERIAFMSRTYSRAVLCFSCMNSSNKSPRSVMSLLNIETLTVFRWTCLIYLCFNKSSRSVWRTEFFVKRINIDLLRTGRVSSILHVIRSPRSVTNWIWSWLGWLEKFCLSSNFSFWLSCNFLFWLSSNFWTQFSCPFVLQWDLWRRSRWHAYFFV